jgi:uncharacterized RDD family membrane protein YckC
VAVRTGVITPEAVVLELPLAGTATRAFARLFDLVLQGVAAALLAWAAVPFANLGASPVLLALTVTVTVLVVLPMATEALWRGRSPGKAVFGLRVVGADGSPEAPRQAAVRALVALVDTYLSLGFLALVGSLLTRTSQRPGDLAAGTVVLRERGRAGVRTPVAFHPPPGFEAYVASLDVGALHEGDFTLIRSFLLRVRTLGAPARRELALGLAEAVRRRIRHELPGPVDPELWLVCVASAYQLRRGGLLADAALGLAPLAPAVVPVPHPPGR